MGHPLLLIMSRCPTGLQVSTYHLHSPLAARLLRVARMPYRILCNDVRREGVKASLDLASGLFCYVPLHKIRYGIKHRYSGEYLKTYYLIDISQVMLDHAVQRTKGLDVHSCVRPLKKDITIDAIPEIAPNSLEKVVAINVLQDIDARAALKNIYNLLRPEGQLRATFIRRDTQDSFWVKDENYDTSKGCLYNFSSLHEEAGIQPLGYVVRRGEQKPFYRVQTYFTQDDVLQMLAVAGYELSQMKEINFPLDIVKTRWSSGFAQATLNEDQEKLLQEWGHFPDAWDVVATKI